MTTMIMQPRWNKWTGRASSLRMMAWVVLCGIAIAAAPEIAVAQDSQAISRALRCLNFDENSARARDTLGFLHFAASHVACSFEGRLGVVDSSGQTVSGDFALAYEFVWDAGGGHGHTTLAFFFNGDGSYEGSRVLKTDAVFNQPFELAKLSIQVVGQLLIEAYGDQMNDNDRRILRELIDRADAKGLLDLQIKLRQGLGL